MSTPLAVLVVVLVTLGDILLALASMSQAAVQQPGAARAWIDTPLAGTRIEQAPVEVLAHATDPDGIVRLELVADGVVVAVANPRRPGDAPAPVLASARLAWRSPTPGKHVLVVTGIDPGGRRGFRALVVVEVERARATPRPTDRPGPRATPRATPRPTPRATPRPTPRPCVPPAPVLESPSDFHLVDTPAENPPTLRWGYRREPDCRPTDFLVRVVDDDGVVVLQSGTGGDRRSLTPPRELANCRTYRWTVRAVGPGGRSRPSSSRSFAISYRCG